MFNTGFGQYQLSDYAINKLAEINNQFNNKSENVKLWKAVAQELEDESTSFEDEKTNKIDNESTVHSKDSNISTQFYFSQNSNISHDTPVINKGKFTENDIQCIEDILFESLEQSNGRLNLNLLQNLSSMAVAEIFDNLNERLSTTGFLNVLKTMSEFNNEQKMKYFDVICAKLIINKLNGVSMDKRIIRNIITKITGKFPEEIKEMIYIPILNFKLQDNTIIMEIVDIIGTQKYNILLSDFVSHANEIQEWHFMLLKKLISPPVEESTKNHLLKMLFDKCTTFSTNLSFGQLIVTFITAGAPFSDTEINILTEIVDVHKTALKKTMNNAIKKL